MQRAVPILTLPVLFLLACEPTPTTPPGPSEAARAELAAISEQLDQIADPVASDPESLNRARKDLAAVAREYGAWLGTQLPGNEDCRMDCLADWLLCGTEGGGIHPMSLPVPQGGADPGAEGAAGSPEAAAAIDTGSGLGHHPPDWIEYCDWKFQKCLMMCQIATDLIP